MPPRRRRLRTPSPRWITAAAFAVAALGAAPAMAHVDVLPAQLTLNEAQELVVRVPNERDVPTVRVSVTFPPQVTVYSFAANPPGWTRKVLLTKDGRNRGVVWTGGSIGVGEYAEFRMLGTPTSLGDALWKSEQTYADGLTKPWTGPPESEGAASQETGPTAPGPVAVTAVVEQGQGGGSTASTTSAGGESNTGVVLGGVALLLAAGALVGLGLLWSRTPAVLPPDDPAVDPAPPPPPSAPARSKRRR